MGSYASSNTTSNTNYSNLPITQEDVTNPINLLNATGNKLGSSELTIGASAQLNTNTTNNVLDGGSIGRAFDFGTHAIGIIADLTRSSNQTAINSATNGTAAAVVGAESIDSAVGVINELTGNKTLIYSAVAIAIAYFWLKRG